ncbi:MAG: hypothetical protein ACK5MK_01890 [Dysgonomonas sp.]
MTKGFTYIYCFFCCISLTCCNQQTKADSNPDKDTLSVKINRFDKELDWYLKNDNIENENKLKSSYKDFLSAFGVVTVGKSDINDKLFFSTLKQYFSNQMLSKIYSDALLQFYDVSAYEKELSVADNLIASHFNGKKLPNIGMHISGFKENTIVLDGFISVSSDKYLGINYPGYTPFFADYQRIQMQPKMITRDILKAWIISERKKTEKKKKLLDEMIDEGRVIYILSALLPEWKDADLIGYDSKKLDWCVKNENDVWKILVKRNFLFNNDFSLVEQFMTDAPNTIQVSKESPGRLGIWVGWQIVKSYIKNSNCTLSDLMDMDSSVIWKESKYNPQ